MLARYLKRLIEQLFHNKVFGYAISRYLISGISFVTSIIVAVKLGSFYLGVWGILLLLRRYLQLSNFGIPDSVTVLIVNNKDNEYVTDYEYNAVCIVALLSLVITLLSTTQLFLPLPFIRKYDISFEFYVLIVTSILTLFNDLFFKIYRVKGRVSELTFYQSIIQLLSFVFAIILDGKILLDALLFAYFLGNIAALTVFLYSGYATISGKFRFIFVKELLSKGLFLFLYNTLFYLILISTRTVISFNYSVNDFGLFTFSLTLANAIILVIDAFAVLIVPKLLDKYNSNDLNAILETIKKVRINYVYGAYGVMCILIIMFSFILSFMDEYKSAFSAVLYMCLVIVIQTHAFPYSMLLMAKNKEKLIAFSSLCALVFNIFLISSLIYFFKTSFEYVIIVTGLSHLLYGWLCIFFSRQTLRIPTTFFHVVRESFPWDLFMVSISIFIIGYYRLETLVFIPLLLFVITGYKSLQIILKSVSLLLYHPKVINIK